MNDALDETIETASGPEPVEEETLAPSPPIRHDGVGSVQLAGTRLVGFVAQAEPGASGVEVREGGLTVAAVRDLIEDTSLLRGCNQLANSDFRESTSNWELTVAAGNDECVLGINLSDDWHPPSTNTAYVHQTGADPRSIAILAYRDPIEGESLPVDERCTYQLAASIALHRCAASLEVEWLDSKGTVITVSRARLDEEASGGTDFQAYARHSVVARSPDDARRARISVKKHGTNRKEDSYLFVHSVLFAEIDPDSPLETWSSPFYSPENLALLRSMGGRGALVFRASLPPDLLDRQEHVLDVICEATGEPLHGSPVTFKYQADCTGAIEKIDGSVVTGWAQDLESPDQPLEVVLAVNGEDVARGRADLPRKRGACGFRLPLPADRFSGRPILAEVRVARSREVVDVTSFLAPSVLTPWDALQRYSHVGRLGQLAPVASERYRSLAEHLAQHAEKGASGETLAQVARAHAELLLGFKRKRATYPPLTLSRPAEPDVSVIVPVHNSFAVTYNCLAALIVAYNDTSFEVIVVDDGSDDETTRVEEIVEGIRVVRHERARGFIRACEAGVAASRGKYVVLLNNDTEPLARWLDEMVFVFDNFADVGLVGSQLLYPDGSLQDAGGVVWDSGDPWNYGRGKNTNDPRYRYTRQVDYVTGASLMIPRALWDEVGGFDESFCPAYFEDTDLAFKVRAAARKVVHAPLSRVVHYEGMSHGTDASVGGKKQQEVNRPKFKRKWSSAFVGGGRIGVDDVDLVKDRGIRYRALFIDQQVPRPDNDAGGYAAIQEIRLVQSLGFKVTFLPDNMAFLGEYTTELERMGVETVHAPFYLCADDFLAKRGKEFDVVYITRYTIAEKHLERVRRYAPQAKVVFCNADLHFLRQLREAVRLRDCHAIQAATVTREEELRVMRRVDLTLSYNPSEHAVILSHNLDSSPVALCPWVVDVVEHVAGFDEREGIAFLGGFGHPPNEGAVRFFAEEVMPLLRQRLPGVRFSIYGSQVPQSIEKLEEEDVVVRGFVPDVADVYQSCRVFVAPLLSGAGLKGKVAAAFAHGTPSVLSPIAAEGIPMRSGREAFIAESPAEWAEAVAALYESRERWEEVSRSAQDLARSEYGFERGRELMRRAFEQVGCFAPESDGGALARQACWPKGHVARVTKLDSAWPRPPRS